MPDSSTIHVHKLEGCRPTPLAHYLKALGILRLVAEQRDPAARGWWRDGQFRLASRLDRDELEAFFLTDYQPTPMVAPWNGGSGFFPKDNKSGIGPIEASVAPRLERFRTTIVISKQVVQHLNEKPNKGAEKNGVIAECRQAWRTGSQAWIDAALALGADGESTFPAMLGTGGNDGRLDFTSNLMQRLVSLFDMDDPNAPAFPESYPRLCTALWSATSPTLESSAIGQFFPSAAGGPNGGSGFEGRVRVNPWDYVLMLEGAILFRSGLARRCQSKRLPQAAAPFAVRGSGAGYGSSDSADEGARGEQWMPLWNQPSRVAEVVSLFREGRSQIDGKSAERGSDMARSIARMGVARGINRFERYGYIERNGLSNLAVPLGSFDVTPRPNQDLLAEIMPWVDQLRRIASDKNAPAPFDRAHRACEEAVFNCTRGGRGSRFLPLLVTLGKAEDQFLKSPRFAAEKYARPIPTLSEQWLDVIREEENSAELRLAIALASQRGKLESNERSQSVRIHWLPLDGSYFAKGESGLSIGPEQSSSGMDLQRALISMMHRRLLAYERGAGGDFIPLRISRNNCGAAEGDIQAFLEQRVDDAKILAIARGLMSVKFASPQTTSATAQARQSLGGLAMYGLLRLAMPVAPIWLPDQTDKQVRCNPTTFYRLKNGSLGGAVEVATRQLAAAGLRPRLRIGVGSPPLARRLAASMAFGISSAMTTRLALGLTQPELGGDERRKLEAASEA